MSEFIKEHGEIIISVLVFTFLLSAAVGIAPDLKDSLKDIIESIINNKFI